MPSIPARLALPLVLASVASSQDARVPFPLTPIAAEGRGAEVRLATDLDAVAALEHHDAIRMVGVPLPDGTNATLALERVDLERRDLGFHVDGAPAPAALEGLAVTVWRGSIEGVAHSDVMLGFSTHGSRGWIRTRTELVHLLASAHENGSWLAAPAVLTTEAALASAGHVLSGECATAPPMVPPSAAAPLGPVPQASGLRTTETITLRACTVAMETDWQFYQQFNDLNAATSYLTMLFAAISDRYEQQASTALTFPYVQIYTTSADPWSTPDVPGTSQQMLTEFRNAWTGSIPMNARLAHFMSGADLGGGVALLNGLCSTSANFAVSGNISGSVNFPVVQQPFNWDFVVVAHEIGHNFNAPHTHSFCPPLDECPSGNLMGPCQTSQVCSNMGTVMSYCHLCPGGTGNITTYFHPANAARMVAASEACNPVVFSVVVDAPDVVSETTPTPASLLVVAGSVSSATLHHRTSAGAPYTQTPMVAQGGGQWLADVPAPGCDADVDLYFSFDVAGVGTFTAPQLAPQETYEAAVGVEVVTFADDFETDTGWQAVNLGATSGDWQRGVPVNDPNWAYDPAADFDGSGSCYLTQNVAGNTDVDNGAVELTSPTLDLALPGTTVRYAYYLRLTNSDGVDRLLVEASDGGPFFEVARHDVDGGSEWREASLTHTDLTAAGVTPGSSMQLRFTANDGNTQSIVEAGLDAFRVTYIDCGGPGIPYCSPAVPNSSGAPATIRAEGSAVVADNDLTLVVESLPAQVFAYFLNSQTAGFVGNPGGSSGDLCVVGSVGRYNASVLNSGLGGTVSLLLDLTATPQPNGFVSVMAGETWNFQCWYRDALIGIPTSNFTDAVAVPFM